jgi:hypothetical protein
VRTLYSRHWSGQDRGSARGGGLETGSWLKECREGNIHVKVSGGYEAV